MEIFQNLKKSIPPSLKFLLAQTFRNLLHIFKSFLRKHGRIMSKLEVFLIKADWTNRSLPNLLALPCRVEIRELQSSSIILRGPRGQALWSQPVWVPAFAGTPHPGKYLRPEAGQAPGCYEQGWHSAAPWCHCHLGAGLWAAQPGVPPQSTDGWHLQDVECSPAHTGCGDESLGKGCPVFIYRRLPKRATVTLVKT